MIVALLASASISAMADDIVNTVNPVPVIVVQAQRRNADGRASAITASRIAAHAHSNELVSDQERGWAGYSSRMADCRYRGSVIER